LAILSFRWLAAPPATLYALLLLLTALCAVATGYLDSALLALCSQYSPRMQGYLQLGIGLGTLVSVLYRDATKLLLNDDMKDATTAYFSIALITVLICLGCYRLLMSLPVSRLALGNSEGYEALLTPPGSPPPASGDASMGTRRLSASFAPVVSPSPHASFMTPTGSRQISPTASGAVSPELDEGAGFAVEDASFRAVLRLVWRNELTIFLNLFLTTLCYPGLLTSIPCRNYVGLRKGHWFETLLLTAFTLSDTMARFLTEYRLGLNWRNVFVTVLVRSILFPLLLICATLGSATDSLAIICVCFFGALNGYCVSLSLIVVNEIPRLSNEQRKTCGRISACSVNSGLAFGSFMAAVLATSIGLGDSSGGA